MTLRTSATFTSVLRSLPSSFTSWVSVAMGGAHPHGYQSRLAEQGLPDVLRVPTGTGKTLAAVLSWLYRCVGHPGDRGLAEKPRA
jgi:CRISPR-associated endonuclease/helicase Cas3